MADAEDFAELRTLVPLLSAYLRRAHGDMSPELRQAFESAGLGPRHGAVLSFVLSSGPVSVGDLARQLNLGLTNASQLSGDLTRAGWLRRESDAADHRRTLLTVPPERRPAVADFLDRRSTPLARAVQRLTPGELAGFRAGLTAWVEEIAAME
ncbi:MarR family winged helix-turn-helix transcriptional regulator [Nocardia sp. alder85J]|uniref:MarR family winged helix-turn-helix transcriptional regulator n=1 Tax=Nocardia sp. alder85J TaxID=2862949 RepID=UPI001CD3D62E|nr:MarR family transcriptional regulator [Nocardia sp. alder85J]MCX4091261.1 MarR family transcriptional regulator [Nocardia sp. alder85J]